MPHWYRPLKTARKYYSTPKEELIKRSLADPFNGAIGESLRRRSFFSIWEPGRILALFVLQQSSPCHFVLSNPVALSLLAF